MCRAFGCPAFAYQASAYRVPGCERPGTGYRPAARQRAVCPGPWAADLLACDGRTRPMGLVWLGLATDDRGSSRL